MTEQQARTAANLVLAAAAVGAAVFILRTPRLRRLAWQFARQYAAGPLAAWAAGSVRTAWDQSGSASAFAPVSSRAMADRSAPVSPRAAAERPALAGS